MRSTNFTLWVWSGSILYFIGKQTFWLIVLSPFIKLKDRKTVEKKKWAHILTWQRDGSIYEVLQMIKKCKALLNDSFMMIYELNSNLHPNVLFNV